MNSLSIKSRGIWPTLFLVLLGFFLTGCGSPPEIGDPKVVEPLTPVLPRAEVSIRIDVSSEVPVSYQWTTDPEGGKIIRGSEASATVWEAPQVPGTYNVYVHVVTGDLVTDKSIAIAVIDATPTPTSMPTYTPTPTYTSTPISSSTSTITPTPTQTPTPRPTEITTPCLIQVSLLSPLPASETVVSAIHTNQAPEIDGCLDEAIWAQAQPLIYAEHPVVNDKTTMGVRLLWDDKYLYAGFEVSDTQVEDSSLLDNVWDGDSVGVILGYEGETYEYRYTIRGHGTERGRLMGDRAGTTQNEAILKGSTNLNDTSDQDAGYTVEMRIPLPATGTAGSAIDADLWSIDHDYNPGKRYDDPDTIFSKISWDGDQSVDTAIKRILLVLAGSQTPPPANTPTPER